MLPLLLVVFGALGTARLTRLLTADQLTVALRRLVMQRVREGGHLEYLISCAWCASVWIGYLVALCVTRPLIASLDIEITFAGFVGLVLAQTLAYSQITGLLASREVEV